MSEIIGDVFGLAGSIYGMMKDPLIWAALILCFAAGRTDRTFFVPILLAIAFQVVVALLVRPRYLAEYGTYNADQYLIEDQLYYFGIRVAIFWLTWFGGWKSRSNNDGDSALNSEIDK